MTLFEMLNKLEGFFDKRWNDEQRAQISKYLTKKKLGEDDIEKLFEKVIENFNQLSYKKLPLIPDIEAIFKTINLKNSAVAFRIESLDKTNNWTIEQIITELKRIRAEAKYSNYDIDFLNKWELLGLEYGFCKDYNLKKDDALRHLRYVKEEIQKGFSYESLDKRDFKNKIENVITKTF